MTKEQPPPNLNPIVYEIWSVEDDRIHGRLLDHKPSWQISRDYETTYRFPGKAACYWTVTHERGITRDDALQFAIRIHEGRFEVLHCDLSPLNANRGW